MKRFEDWVEIFYPRYLMRCVEIKDTVLDFLCLIFKKGLAMHPLVCCTAIVVQPYCPAKFRLNRYRQWVVAKVKKWHNAQHVFFPHNTQPQHRTPNQPNFDGDIMPPCFPTHHTNPHDKPSTFTTLIHVQPFYIISYSIANR
jgi:hypothetical protein